jgi:glycosyltransferase involved in cell wall biosynthesis
MHFIALGRELVRRSHTVFFLTDNRRTADDPDMEVLAWPSGRPTRPVDAVFLAKLIRKRRPDCLLANFGSVNVMTIVGWAMQVPHRIVWHHTLTSQIPEAAKWKIRRRRVVLRRATHLVPVSMAATEDLVDVFGVPARKCSVHPYSLAVPLVQRSRKPKGFLCPSRFHESKGQDVLIRAVARLPHTTVDFVGPGDATPFYELAKSLGVESRCKFLGSESHDSILERMAGSLATVVPSRSDARPIVVMESLAVGTPVIASRAGGIPEIFRDSIHGNLVPPEDPDSLAQALSMMTPERSHQLGAAAKDYFSEHYEQGTVVTKLADWLENLVVHPKGT